MRRKKYCQKCAEKNAVKNTQKKSLHPQYSFEALFRSQQFALMDNACREFVFIGEFFMVTRADAVKMFKQVLGSTLQTVTKEVSNAQHPANRHQGGW